MPLIVVVFPGPHCSGPEEAEPPLLSGTLRLLPMPPFTNTGSLLPLLPAALGCGAAPAIGPRPLPAFSELPHAIEPSKAMPVHKENGMVFISDFLRSIGCDTPGNALAARAPMPAAQRRAGRRKRPYDLECSDSMTSGGLESTLVRCFSRDRASKRILVHRWISHC